MALALLSRKRAPLLPPAPADLPGVTAIVPAYKEAALIADKVTDLRENGYPGALQIVVVADDPETADAARGSDAELISDGQRLGKAEALNRGVAAAREPILVITDANTRLTPGSLEALVRWFAQPEVGAVAGEKRVVGGGQSAYWRFESWLKQREARLGTTFGIVGELAAVRRSLYRELPADLAVDDLWLALDVCEQGAQIRYEPDAVALEDPSPGAKEEWERRTRVVCGVLDVLWRRRALLGPGGGVISFELWGHRLVRSSAGPLAHALLLAGAVRHARTSRVAACALLAHAVAATAVVRQARGATLSPPERIAAQALFLQAVGLGGLVRFARGDRPALWQKTPR